MSSTQTPTSKGAVRFLGLNLCNVSDANEWGLGRIVIFIVFGPTAAAVKSLQENKRSSNSDENEEEAPRVKVTSILF